MRGTHELIPTAERLSDDDVLTTVVALSRHYHAPSTSLIILQLARSGVSRHGLDSSVAQALQRLRSRGLVASVTHRGTRHWTPVAD